MEPEGSRPCSQHPDISFCPEPDQSSPRPQSYLLNINFNPFQPSDAMWRHTFHLSLISCLLPSDSSSHLSTLRWLFYARLYMLKSPNIWAKVPVLACFVGAKIRKNWHVLDDTSIYSGAQKSQRSVLRWLQESLGKSHAYYGQMKRMTPHGITGLERVNIILRTLPKPSKWCLSHRFPYQNPSMHFSSPRNVLQAPPISCFLIWSSQ
jgi:hypothetical protein